MMPAPKLDPRETHARIPSPHPGLHLFLRHLPPPEGTEPRGVVLYVHGGTFPSALSIAYRFDGRSWRDELCAAGFHVWGQAYLDSDPASRNRNPPAVKTPGGAFQDIFDAWAGALSYDPESIRAPVAIIRGAWDSMCSDADAAWLLNAMPTGRDLKIPRATHLMHLEENRYHLYRATEAFLTARED